MPSYCCVINCRNNRKKNKVTIHRIPAIVNFPHKPRLNELSRLRREKWLAAIRRPDLFGLGAKNAAVCSQHFISGKPAGLADNLSPDWVPSVNMGYKKKSGKKRIPRRKSNLECPTTEKEEVRLVLEVRREVTVELMNDEDTDTTEDCFSENNESTQCSNESFWAADDRTEPYTYTVTKLNKESNTKSVWTIRNDQEDINETSEQSNYTVTKLNEKGSTSLSVKSEPEDFNEIFIKSDEMDRSSSLDAEENYEKDMYISENEEEFFQTYNSVPFEFIKHELYDHMPADQEVSVVLGLP